LTDINELVEFSVITFDVPFMINIPDGAYRLIIDDIPAQVILKRNKSPSAVSGLPRGVQFPSDSYIQGDRFGRFNYTSIKIVFHHEIYIKPSILFQDRLVSNCIKIINRILDVCRGVKGDHYSRINIRDIFSHNLKYFNHEKKEVPGGAFEIFGNQVSMGGAEPTEQQVKRIREILLTNGQLPLWQSLLLDAYDSHFYSNYRTAILESGTAFEVFIYEFIRQGYLRIGKPELQINNILEAGFKNLLEYHIKNLTGFDFFNSKEYSAWYTDSYDKRNKIVHRGFNASDLDSYNAVTKVGDTIKFIMSK
jgi:hypothetical protein